MITAPCKDCPDRHYACWGSCEKYKAFRKELDRAREARRDEMLRKSVTSESLERTMKRIHWKGW